MAPATVSGFIIPDGDSFPTTAHSAVPAPNNVAPDVDANPSASITTSHTVTSSTATATPLTERPSAPFPPAAIAGIVLAVLTVIGVVFFFVRRHFIRQRASKVTPARARAASQVAISGPIDFQHVSSADGNAPVWNTEDKVSMNAGAARPKHEAASENPNKQKYNVNFGEMESGLQDHVQAMHFARQDSF